MQEALIGLIEVAGSSGEVKLSEIVEWLIEEGRWASVARKAELLQALIDEVVAEELGRERGELRRASQEGRVSRWRCSRCGSQQAGEFRYSGSYQRTVVFAEGSARLRIPRIRCRCGGSVPPDFGALLPKRRRYWHDLQLAVIEQYAEGFSYRAIQRWLRRRSVFVGVSGLPGLMEACRDVGLHVDLAAGRLRAGQADAAFWRLGAGSAAILHLTEVLPQEPAKRVGRHWVRHQTGQVVASLVAPTESLGGWTELFDQVYHRGWVTEKGEIFLTSDGNQGLRGAADLVFGFGRQQRCTWHIGHRARQYAPKGREEAVERAVHHVFNAETMAELHDRFVRFVRRFRREAPEAVHSVARKLPQAVAHWVATDHPVRPKTSAIAERHNLEYKRRLRATRGLYRQANLEALVRLIDLKHNCARQPGADWLHLVARDLWPQPVPLHHSTATHPLPPRPTTTTYTTGGT
jgi:transposase-like protein